MGKEGLGFNKLDLACETMIIPLSSYHEYSLVPSLFFACEGEK